jgi:hypothetical protein
MAPAQAGAPAAQAAALPEAVPPAPLANDVVHGQAADALFAGGAVEVAAEPPAAAAEIAAEPPAAAAAAAPAAPAVPVAPAAAPAAPADTDSDASSDSDSDDEGINHPVDDDDGFDADLGDLDLAPPMLGAGGLDDDGGPPPLDDMMEVELHVAIDELLGIRGPVSVLVRNVMWFVAFNAVYLGVFAFVPFSIGTQFCAVASTHPHFAGLAERAARLLPERAWQLYGDLYASSAENNSTLRFPDMLMITLGYLLIGAMVRLRHVTLLRCVALRCAAAPLHRSPLPRSSPSKASPGSPRRGRRSTSRGACSRWPAGSWRTAPGWPWTGARPWPRWASCSS